MTESQEIQRYLRLEEKVSAMEVRQARLENDHGHLAPQIVQLTTEVKALRTTIDQSKGAVWVIGGMGALAGALAHWLSDLFRNHS